MKISYFLILVLTSPFILFAEKDYTKLVNPFVGTAGHGHTFPGAARPFSMVQLSPDTDIRGWDWCAGYHSSDSSIMGFSHTHLSGTGGADYGDILVMPFSGDEFLRPGTKEDPDSGYRSRFKYENEKAEPGYYSVFLDDYRVLAELTTTEHVGFHKYNYESNQSNGILIDLNHGISDRTVAGYIKLVDETHIEGYRYSTGWAKDQKIFFAMELSQAIENIRILKDGIESNDKQAKGKSIVAALSVKNKSLKEVMLKVGISFVRI